jgi:hypothetical protein
MTDFIRKEREHLAALQGRMDYLRQERPQRREEPDYIPGELQALAWAVSVLTGLAEPIDLRVERVERTLKGLSAKVGRIEQELREEEDE